MSVYERFLKGFLLLYTSFYVYLADSYLPKECPSERS